MKDVYIATCYAARALTESDRLLRRALEDLGFRVYILQWETARVPKCDDVLLVRSTWNYSALIADFREWLAGASKSGCTVINDYQTLMWNLDKRYILEIAGAGARILTSVVITDPLQIGCVLEEWQTRRAVLKPTVGSGGLGVVHVDRDGPLAGTSPVRYQYALSRIGPATPYILQEFAPEFILNGEISGVFIGSRFSHAFTRATTGRHPAFVNVPGIQRRRCDLSSDIVVQMAEVLRLMPVQPAYARMDGIVRGKAFILNEIEVIEPDLAFDLYPAAAKSLAGFLDHFRRTEHGLSPGAPRIFGRAPG